MRRITYVSLLLCFVLGIPCTGVNAGGTALQTVTVQSHYCGVSYIKNDGTLYVIGCMDCRTLDGVIERGAETKWSIVFPLKIAEGISSTMFGHDNAFRIDNEGVLWSCGVYYSGKLGARGDGRLQGSGRNYDNVTYTYDILEDVVQVSEGGNHALALTVDGSLWGWGTQARATF